VSTLRRRYNARIQRAKGLLELAAALYDTSLSTRTTRAAEQVLQTESRVGAGITLALRPATGADDVALAFAADGFRELEALAAGRVSLVWINPSVAATMALTGKGPFRRRLPIRVIATFPSWDVMGFAVHESTGITSLAEIRKRRVPLRLSTGAMTRRALLGDPTMFAVTAVMKAAGFTFADLRRWGGRIQSVSRPSHPERRAAIERGAVTAVFDEGIKSWGQTAVDRGFRYLPLDGPVMKRLLAMGFRAAVVPKARFSGLAEDVPTVDFSGWPMVVRRDMPEEVAYALCEALEARRDLIPTDNYKPLDIAQLCANDVEAPYDVPLHPGAARFYRERGYLG
jgi:TRAP-type uncharacterized transport system substrate-binding protein